MKPGERSHTNNGPGGIDYHVHEDCEAFLIIQGSGSMQLNGSIHPLTVGDIVVIEPAEDHHICSDPDNPIVTLWCHAGPERHRNQQ